MRTGTASNSRRWRPTGTRRARWSGASTRATIPSRSSSAGHVYPKGAQLAHQLRRLLGDSAFWAGMQRFLADNAYKAVTTTGLCRRHGEDVRHCDLDWFFDQWAYGVGYPKVQVTRHWDAATKTLQLVVRQTQPIDSLHPLFRFPATIRVITARLGGPPRDHGDAPG